MKIDDKTKIEFANDLIERKPQLFVRFTRTKLKEKKEKKSSKK
jgi:hypothetical protein